MKIFLPLKIILIFTVICFIISCNKEDFLTSITDISQHILVKPYRYHQPFFIALDKDPSSGVNLVTENENQYFNIEVVGLDERADCIVNSIGTQQFKVIDDGDRHALKIGISDRCLPSTGHIDSLYPLVLIIEDIRDNRQFLKAYHYVSLGEETTLKSLPLLKTNNTGKNKFESKSLFELNTSPTYTKKEYFNNEITIDFPSGLFQSQTEEHISFGSNDNAYNAQITYLKPDMTESILGYSAFPIPAVATSFLDQDQLPVDRIAEFVRTDYIGLDIIHKNTGKKAAFIDTDSLLKVSVNTNYGIINELNIWRFYRDIDGLFKWEEVDDAVPVDSNGLITFESPLSIGWAISSSPPLPVCNTTTPNAPSIYATANFNLTSSINNLRVADLYEAKLFRQSGINPIPWADVVMNGNSINVYHLTEQKTVLKLYRKTLGGTSTTASKIVNLNCGDIINEDLTTAAITRMEVDINDAYCTTKVISLEKTCEIYAMEEPDSLSTNQPSISNSNWHYLGFLNAGKINTYLLEHGKHYWFKLSAPEYNNGTHIVFHRPITIKHDGIKPQSPYENQEEGQLICVPIGPSIPYQDYQCEYKIKEKNGLPPYPVDSLYGTGGQYCGYLL